MGASTVAHSELGSCDKWLNNPQACGVVPDQRSNPCPLQWQADSQPLGQQGSSSFSSSLPYIPVLINITNGCQRKGTQLNEIFEISCHT